VTPNSRHGSSVVEFPSELEIVTTRTFDAPVELVWDVMTRPEHVRHWFAPLEDEVTECEIDLRVGGDYRIVFVTPQRSSRTVELEETDGVTTVTMRMAFRDKAGRAHMPSNNDGQTDSFDKLEDYLRSLVEQGAKASG
jgi:uncharacterized protein YndB with AHSA1/START domain